MRSLVLFLTIAAVLEGAPVERWSASAVNQWYATQPWLVGSDYIPSTAINQLEMWQAETFDPQRIDLELRWAESLGMNIMRVFLHDLLWQTSNPSHVGAVRFLLGAESAPGAAACAATPVEPTGITAKNRIGRL